MRAHTLIPVSLFCLLTASPVMAQEPTRPDKPTRPDVTSPTTPHTTPQSTTSQASARGADSILASCLIVDNENEIALAQLAQERAKSDEVKQFAKKMIDDHRQMVTKLQKVASTTGTSDATMPGHGKEPLDASGRRENPAGGTTPPPTTTPPTRTDTGRADVPSTQGQGVAGQVAGHQAGKPLDFVALKKDLGRECLATAKRELEAKSGADFDKCYMYMAVAAHMHAVDTLKVFRNYASGELRQTLSDALPTVQAHLEHAKTMTRKFEGQLGDKAGSGTNGK